MHVDESPDLEGFKLKSNETSSKRIAFFLLLYSF